MLMRKMVALREGMQKGNLNPLWVESMLQNVSDNNRTADFFLRPVFATLRRPSLAEIKKVLAKKTHIHSLNRFRPDLPELFESVNWTAGPDEVDVTIVTKKNLFSLKDHNLEEGEVIELAFEQGLAWCPGWVVPALALYAESRAPMAVSETFSINFCLAFDQERKAGFTVAYRKDWILYNRSVNRKSSWPDEMRWLFVKPRT